MAKNILCNGLIKKEKDNVDLDLNFSKEKFGCKFLSNKKIFLIKYSHYPIFGLSSKQILLAICLSNILFQSIQYISFEPTQYIFAKLI